MFLIPVAQRTHFPSCHCWKQIAHESDCQSIDISLHHHYHRTSLIDCDLILPAVSLASSPHVMQDFPLADQGIVTLYLHMWSAHEMNSKYGHLHTHITRYIHLQQTGYQKTITVYRKTFIQLVAVCASQKRLNDKLLTTV